MATRITTRILVQVGLIPMSRPSATPANETWDNVSAISDCLRNTKNNPNIGAMNEINNEAWKALCMNP